MMKGGFQDETTIRMIKIERRNPNILSRLPERGGFMRRQVRSVS